MRGDRVEAESEVNVLECGPLTRCHFVSSNSCCFFDEILISGHTATNRSFGAVDLLSDHVAFHGLTVKGTIATQWPVRGIYARRTTVLIVLYECKGSYHN